MFISATISENLRPIENCRVASIYDTVGCTNCRETQHQGAGLGWGGTAKRRAPGSSSGRKGVLGTLWCVEGWLAGFLGVRGATRRPLPITTYWLTPVDPKLNLTHPSMPISSSRSGQRIPRPALLCGSWRVLRLRHALGTEGPIAGRLCATGQSRPTIRFAGSSPPHSLSWHRGQPRPRWPAEPLVRPLSAILSCPWSVRVPALSTRREAAQR